MTRFAYTTTSEAEVAADPARIWAALTDPPTLVALTPLLTGIDADGDTWTWRMQGLSALGVGLSPVFTEAMTFQTERRIDFTHAPPAGSRERAGAEGSYRLAPTDGGTHLAITLTVRIDVPLPSVAKPAVTGAMRSTMDRMGDRFAANLVAHLKADPAGQ